MTVMMSVLPVGWKGDWHENPAPQWIVPLSGTWYVEAMDGTRAEMGPGQLAFGEDQGCRKRDGKTGHTSGTVGNETGRAHDRAVRLEARAHDALPVRLDHDGGREMTDPFEIRDPRFEHYVLTNAGLEELATGFRWIEGPVWMGDWNCLLFQDLPRNRTMRWSEAGGVSVFRDPSNYANGQARDLQGRLIACSHRGRCVTRTEHDGTVTILVDRHRGRRLNAPNDVVVKSDGTIWFTDPLYGILNDYEGGRQVSEQPPALYRYDPETDELRVAAGDFDGPNGLAFSPDERRLYVSETGDQTHDEPRQYIRVFDGRGGRHAVRRRGVRQGRARLLRRHEGRRGRQRLVERGRRGAVFRAGRRTARQDPGAVPRLEHRLGRRALPQPPVHRRLANAVRDLPQPPRRPAPGHRRAMSGLRIAAVRLLCPDPDRTAAFYAAAFGGAVTRAGDAVTVSLGEQRLELVRTAARPASPARSTSTAFQHCAIIVSDMAAAMAKLGAAAGWSAISRDGPEQLPASTGGVAGFKFRDPDGHPLEFLCFPPTTIPPAWRGRDGLFLGIDHTAITVADTETSAAFYGGLGFTVASRGINRGIEQARMDDVDDPVVEVTGLSPPGGAPPHLELLCYREPGTTRVILPPDDVLATRIVITGGDSALDEERIDPDGHRFVLQAVTRP